MADAVEVNRVQQRILAIADALARVESDHAEALADITANGTQVMRTVLDSKRRPIQKMGLNPACSVITVTERMRRSLTKQLKSLNDELKALEKEQKQESSPLAKWAPKERKQ